MENQEKHNWKFNNLHQSMRRYNSFQLITLANYKFCYENLTHVKKRDKTSIQEKTPNPSQTHDTQKSHNQKIYMRKLTDKKTMLI